MLESRGEHFQVSEPPEKKESTGGRRSVCAAADNRPPFCVCQLVKAVKMSVSKFVSSGTAVLKLQGDEILFFFKNNLFPVDGRGGHKHVSQWISTFLKFKLRTYFKSFKFHGTLADLHLSSDLSWLLSFILKGLNLATADLTW